MAERRILSTAQKGRGGRTTSSSLTTLVVGAVGVVVVLLAALLWIRSPPPQAITPTVQPTAAPNREEPGRELRPTWAPTAPDIAPYVMLIEELIEKGEYREAQSVAQATLDIEGLREADRRILNGYVISLGLDIIENTIFEPLDRTQHQHLVETYLSLRERARVSDVELESPLQVAKDAHASSQHPLAKVAVEAALEDDLFNPKINLDTTKLYASTLFGIGRWYTTAPKDSPLYEEGLRALVTSDCVADRYKTGQSEAQTLLEQLGYTDQTTWPQPMDTLLLPEGGFR